MATRRAPSAYEYHAKETAPSLAPPKRVAELRAADPKKKKNRGRKTPPPPRTTTYNLRSGGKSVRWADGQGE